MSQHNNFLPHIAFNQDNLVPVIVQQHDSGEVLMMAWMNKESLEETIATGRMCYWSRSRKSLWRKGERSGQVQHLKEMTVDCDGDTLLAKVDQEGVACHTGRRSCFYRTIENGTLSVNQEIIISPETLYDSSL